VTCSRGLPRRVVGHVGTESAATNSIAEFADWRNPPRRPQEVARPVELTDDELGEFLERLEKPKNPLRAATPSRPHHSWRP